jgi:hypothetical protein
VERGDRCAAFRWKCAAIRYLRLGRSVSTFVPDLTRARNEVDQQACEKGLLCARRDSNPNLLIDRRVSPSRWVSPVPREYSRNR